MDLLNDPKIKVVRYRTDLILALLKHEHQRRELAEAREQRKHEVAILKLKAQPARIPEESDPGEPSASEAVEAARDFLARLNKEKKQ